MPIKIANDLPAKAILEEENVFIMDESRAYHQDIRPLKIMILNLMPTKVETETQLLRLLGNTPLQVEITLIHPKSYTSKNTPMEHLLNFYRYFEEIKHQKFDGMVITGAPVEQMDFEEVDYWEELTCILDWSKTNVTSTFHICWGAQAGLYYHYGIAKHPLEQKLFGVFPYEINNKKDPLFRGFDDVFYYPQSRHTDNKVMDVLKHPKLELLSGSIDSGVNIVASEDRRQIFITGHFEYDPLTLHKEYIRDKDKGLGIQVPCNYYPKDNSNEQPKVIWRSHANLFFSNWLNYYVYQETPYSLDTIEYEI